MSVLSVQSRFLLVGAALMLLLIALTNIRQRLEMMCKGKLTIMPGEGGGTRVTIRIPD